MNLKLLGQLRERAGVLSRCRQLCVWVCAWVYVCARKRTLCTLLCTLAVLVLVLLLQWGMICLNIQSWWHVHRVCLDYSSKDVEGSMCALLCVDNDVESLSCQSYYVGKEAVFSASWNSVQVIFKSPRPTSMPEAEALYWVDTNRFIHYPSEEEFGNMISNNIKIKFNMSLSDSLVRNISRFHYRNNHTVNRFTEMRNLWFLLQDNEYLAMQLYEKYNLFPKLIGSCGPFYAMQRLQTISTFSHLFSTDETKEEWNRRVHVAILIMDFLRALEKLPPEPLYLCDVKLNHFGFEDSFDKVKFLDLDAVHPRSVAHRIVGDGSPCRQDSDCDFVDCRSHCNGASKTCVHGVANNNLQLVCEKVLLGWAVSGRVLVPGLLAGPHAPRPLLDLLQRCAAPDRASALGVTPARSLSRAPAPSDMHDRIYNILVSLRSSNKH